MSSNKQRCSQICMSVLACALGKNARGISDVAPYYLSQDTTSSIDLLASSSLNETILVALHRPSLVASNPRIWNVKFGNTKAFL